MKDKKITMFVPNADNYFQLCIHIIEMYLFISRASMNKIFTMKKI